MEIKEPREHLIQSPEIKNYLGLTSDFDYYTQIDVDFIERILELESLASYQVPKIVKAELYISTRCPSCKYDLSKHIYDGYHEVNKVKFCPDCGQALKWE